MGSRLYGMDVYIVMSLSNPLQQELNFSSADLSVQGSLEIDNICMLVFMRFTNKFGSPANRVNLRFHTSLDVFFH